MESCESILHGEESCGRVLAGAGEAFASPAYPASRTQGGLMSQATFCILLAKSRPAVGGGSGLPSCL
jgi:hypothetical protein